MDIFSYRSFSQQGFLGTSPLLYHCLFRFWCEPAFKCCKKQTSKQYVILLSDWLNLGSSADWGCSPLHLKRWIQLRSDWWSRWHLWSCLWTDSSVAAQRIWSVRCLCCSNPIPRSCVWRCLHSFCIQVQTAVRSHRTKSSWKGKATIFIKYLHLFGINLSHHLYQILYISFLPLSLWKFLHSLEPIGKALVFGKVVVIAGQLKQLDLSNHFKFLIR